MIYKEVHIDKDQIQALYKANNWTNYTNNIERLIDGFNHSLYAYGAYDDNRLVGVIRVIGDGHTIVHIQDILVDPLFHRQGIGTTLMKHVLRRYSDVLHISLTTDNTEVQQRFYESLGFVAFKDKGLEGYYYNKDKNSGE